MRGEMVQDLDAPRLRVVLREILSGERRDLEGLTGGPASEAAEGAAAEPGGEPKSVVRARWAR